MNLLRQLIGMKEFFLDSLGRTITPCRVFFTEVEKKEGDLRCRQGIFLESSRVGRDSRVRRWRWYDMKCFAF